MQYAGQRNRLTLDLRQQCQRAAALEIDTHGRGYSNTRTEWKRSERLLRVGLVSASDGAGAAGAIIELDYKPLAQSALDIDSHGSRQANQLRGHQNLEVTMSHVAIRSQVLALCIGVDRHLGNLASTDRRDEVNSHDPATFSE